MKEAVSFFLSVKLCIPGEQSTKRSVFDYRIGKEPVEGVTGFSAD